MPRPRRNCRRDSFSSEFHAFDSIPFLELASAFNSSRKRTSRQSTKRRGAATTMATPTVPRDVNNTIIVLDDSDEDCVSTVISRSRAINENVKNKVEDIFKSSGLLSDDEDEPVSLHAKSNDKTSCNKDILTNINIDEPSSSTCEKRVAESNGTKRVIVVEDDEISTVEDIKNYCDETEDILKNANAILEKFAGTSSQVEQPTQKELPDVQTKGANQEKRLECPICYESLSEKQVMTTKCGHLFCKACIERVATTIKKCPTCRKAVNRKNIIPIYI